MNSSPLQKHGIRKVTAGGVLISLGIIYGDIGTSPIYALRFIMGDQVITRELVLGGLSCIFWTLTILTTVKYIYFALNADNKGEGGIFALYALVRRYKAKWVVFPAIIGCSTLIADGFITPAMSVTSAVEGLQTLNEHITEETIICIVVVILLLLFFFQQFGSAVVGKTFGPIMLIWFFFIGITGALTIRLHPDVFEAINPIYAISLLIKYPGGFWLLGAVFLCTTGAEALYSDLGHCGKKNVRVGWTFVKICLILSYFGQGAWLLAHEGEGLDNRIPFFEIIPAPILFFSVILATLATVIASQALISGAFSLINEAMKLRLWVNMPVRYPSQIKGQIYLPTINWVLMFGSIAMVLIFRRTARMEAAYGLAITVDMLMTTTLLVYYFAVVNRSKLRSASMAMAFLSIEITFLISNLSKFQHGGWFAFLIASVFFCMMYTLHKANMIRERHTNLVDLQQYIPVLKMLQEDISIPKTATHLVYMAATSKKRFIDANIIYSIFKKSPKRADTYWFVHVDTVDSPYTSQYIVDTIIPKHCFFIRIKVGFKADHRVNLLFDQILQDMAASGEVDLTSNYPCLRKNNMPADFKFIVLRGLASVNSQVSSFENLVMQVYAILKKINLPYEQMYGLELANVEIEKVPILVGPSAKIRVKRVNKSGW